MRISTKKLGVLFLGISFMVLYCEFLIYYVVIAQCHWPELNKTDSKADVLRVFMLTDIHMLGFKMGNKIDKWRRDWQMHRAFQTIITLHSPDVVFVLGDIFDEGEWAEEEQFNEYAKSFYEKFYVPNHIKLFIIAGNHDVGFHNATSFKTVELKGTYYPLLKFLLLFRIRKGNIERFYNKLNTSSVQLLTLKNNHFVLINSMAMEGDDCNLCKNARDDIERISDKLSCSRNSSQCNKNSDIKLDYSRPILIQHFPLYRESDAVCTEPDAAPKYEKDTPFRNKIDAISKEATDYLAMKIRPRAAFGGHTHYGCLVHHEYQKEDVDFLEYSIPSFSWRNIFTPKYMLVTVTPEDYAINKCGLPGEHTIAITAVVILFATIYIVRKRV